MQECLMYEKIYALIDGENIDLTSLVLPLPQKGTPNYWDRRKKDLINKAIKKYGFICVMTKLHDLHKVLIEASNYGKLSSKNAMNVFMYASMTNEFLKIVEKYYLPEIYIKALMWLTNYKISLERISQKIAIRTFNDDKLLGLENDTENQQLSLFESVNPFASRLSDLCKAISLRDKTRTEFLKKCSSLCTKEEISNRAADIIDALADAPKTAEINIFIKLFNQVLKELFLYLDQLEEKRKKASVYGEDYAFLLLKS